MKFNPGQLRAHDVMRGSYRYIMLVGGSRSGKTFQIVRAIIARALKAPGSRHLILRFRMNAARASIWSDTLPSVVRMCYPELSGAGVLRWHKQDGYVVLPNGSEIWIGGLDEKKRLEKILGTEYVTIFLNECSQIPYASVTTALTRLAQKCPEIRNRAYFDLNPVGKNHWTYKLFILLVEPESGNRLPDPELYAHCFLNPIDNRENIDPDYLRSLAALPLRQQQRFLRGEYVTELEGALWSLELIDKNRVEPSDVPRLTRIVISVDPSGADDAEDYRSDEIGIVPVGKGENGHGYVLEDCTLRGSPAQWANVVKDRYHAHGADVVVGEVNFGGALVEANIRHADRYLAFKQVTATRGKHIRAEPVATLYELGLIHHVGKLPIIEEQLTNFTRAGYMGGKSPNNADAMFWGITELFEHDLSLGLVEYLKRTQKKIEESGLNAEEFIERQKEETKEKLEHGQKIAQSQLIKPVLPEKNADACPLCGSQAIIRVPGGRHCNQCGNDMPTQVNQTMNDLYKKSKATRGTM